MQLRADYPTLQLNTAPCVASMFLRFKAVRHAETTLDGAERGRSRAAAGAAKKILLHHVMLSFACAGVFGLYARATVL